MTRYYLGIDGGGSKTLAVLAEGDASGWREIGRGEAGPSNLVAVAAELGLAQLEQAVQCAFRQANRPTCTVEAACLAMAGSDRASVRDVLADWANARQLARAIEVVHDAVPLLAWFAAGSDAVALISGTGSLAWGRTAAGQTARAGGWGALLGDEGSGYWLVRRALQAVTRQHDGRGAATVLGAVLLPELGVAQIRDLPVVVAHTPRDQLARLAGLVLAVADQGDPVAEAIRADAATQLTQLVLAVRQQLQIGSGGVHLALAGGVILTSPPLRSQVLQSLEQAGATLDSTRDVPEPAQGAVQLAWAAGSR